MKSVQADESLHHPRAARLPSLSSGLLLVLLAASAGACDSLESTVEAPATALRGSQAQALEDGNGLSANGLSANGLSVNGLSVNGLSVNGLSRPDFAAWFAQSPAQNDQMMRYIVRCAVPADEVRTYRDPQTQLVYTWGGALGLAPGWASGQPATLTEQQLVSACLAAHVNKYGASVSISVLGQTATGQTVPFTLDELARFSRREACYFGNLFTGEGIFFGTDGPGLHSNESTSRACALSGDDNVCLPITYAGHCNQLCERVSHGTFYTSCERNGVTYQPLTTRISKREIYRCGDGVCQFTESCGRGSRPDSCEADCGRCSSER